MNITITSEMIKYNLIKVLVGFLFGTILLYFIKDLNFIIISVIQLVFFTLLYSGIDFIYNKLVNNYDKYNNYK